MCIRDRSLINEIEQTGKLLDKDAYAVRSIFIGGGTPSLLSGKQIERIMLAVRNAFFIMEEAEITMETNPGTLTTVSYTHLQETVIEIDSEEGEKQLGKPRGIYVTLEGENMAGNDGSFHEEMSECLAKRLQSLLLSLIHI